MSEPSPDAAWDPDQYGRFAADRGRPFRDLLARVPNDSPRLVVDLGCGPGDLTRTLADRWPEARIIGVDNSAEMLERARAADVDSRVEWVRAAVEDWDPASCGGPIEANATLQWAPTHLRLVQAWVRALPPGGTFAMQVPANFSAPSHRLMREVADRHPRAADLRPRLDRANAVARPETYAALLLDVAPVVDVWSTTYQHVLAAGAADQGAAADYEQALEEAYPRRPSGVLFPFSRIFAVARAAL